MKSKDFNGRFHNYLLSAFLLMGVIFITSFGCSNAAANKEKAAVEEGGQWFKSYCVMCHGEKADGKGNMASMLNTPPLNLTTIAKRRNGVFPDAEIAKIIAGIENVPGHSTGDMPIWWETFKKSENITDDKVLQEKIDHIVAYLKTIQQ
ncbi:MAG: c-type cytochrome [Lewinellaceae bacterium]|nr:c-type cytochrome [Saprospiraceae bacterium]MCB9338220.1 c-type cytochrome [Lewinellaceae bacterium]